MLGRFRIVLGGIGIFFILDGSGALGTSDFLASGGGTLFIVVGIILLLVTWILGGRKKKQKTQ